ncbi:response regulator [Virgibacillus halodenitrificans]|uniref:response regulator n=1 Tax=Virgibacillus halodenitrificans TaxID=1482 RepID=UPI00045C7CD0|nr:response regulator [Virgibacillus halodenitrificans]CDQ30926.1 Transcriptional regulatory protein CitT [Virgibacillus halodenitrificans]
MIQVLIAEDDFRIANIHEKFLEKITGLQVIGKALNGKETLDFVSKQEVDLLLLDIYMPDLQGNEMIRDLRKINPELDIIIISVAAEKEIVEESIRNGVFDYILKPVKINQFLETIERYKTMKERIANQEEIDQPFLDELLGKQKLMLEEEGTPKGIDPLTLKKVEEIMEAFGEGLTAEETGKKIGVSRTTARRYLEYLISVGCVTAELEYGIVGRPERKYHYNKIKKSKNV